MISESEAPALKLRLGNDGREKVGAIFRILEIGSPNIAQAKEILGTCKRLMELESTVGVNTDAF